MARRLTRFIRTRPVPTCLVTGIAALAILALSGNGDAGGPGRGRGHGNGHGNGHGGGDEAAKVQIGFEISPVELDLRGLNPALVGLGSYIVNAQAGCADCHTSPQYVSGGNPFLGQPEQVNTASFLGGGRFFGPVIVSDNITPDPETGLPGGMTLDEFEEVLRTGFDRDQSAPPVPSPDNDLLQVMPWTIYRNMSSRDIEAVYEYLSAIPSVE